MRIWPWFDRFLKKLSAITRCLLYGMFAIDRFDCIKLFEFDHFVLEWNIELPSRNKIQRLDPKMVYSNLRCYKNLVDYLGCSKPFRWKNFMTNSGRFLVLPKTCKYKKPSSYVRYTKAVLQRCFVKNGVLGYFVKLTGKHLYQSLFF